MTDSNYQEAFIKSKKQFISDLNDLLLYTQSVKTKYEKLYESDDCHGLVRVFLQRKTRNIVKVYVRFTGFGNDDPISLTVDDDEIKKQILNLPSLTEMKDNLIEIEELASQSRLYDRLKHNI